VFYAQRKEKQSSLASSKFVEIVVQNIGVLSNWSKMATLGVCKLRKTRSVSKPLVSRHALMTRHSHDNATLTLSKWCRRREGKGEGVQILIFTTFLPAFWGQKIHKLCVNHVSRCFTIKQYWAKSILRAAFIESPQIKQASHFGGSASVKLPIPLRFPVRRGIVRIWARARSKTHEFDWSQGRKKSLRASETKYKESLNYN
jgi:hypothetical protein